MMYYSHAIRVVTLIGLIGLGSSCAKYKSEDPDSTPDTIKAAPGFTDVKPDSSADTAVRKDTTHSNLPPMAKAVEPDRLAALLPHPSGWTPGGELQKEIQMRDNFNKSRVMQTYTNGSKKLTVEINDFAYVPYLYEPYTQFKGNYLNDDNFARTETTTIAGYHAVQTMEKKDPHGHITVFPGNRYVVTVTMEGAENINEIRSIVEGMDLHGIEALQ